MIKLQGKLPRGIMVAVSGGVDSVAALDFLSRNHEVTALYFNHGTTHGLLAQEFLQWHCAKKSIPLLIGTMEAEDVDYPPPRRSKEEWWRECRYKFFDKFPTQTVVTCHHLDDCVETWIWSSLNGTGKIVPYRRKNVIRPFRLTRKRDLELWCQLNGLKWIEDESNKNIRFARNYIRHEMMPHVLEINPGIHKTIAKKVKEDTDGL